MGRDHNEEIPLLRALGIFGVSAIVIVLVCIFIGEMFFWDKFETVDPLDKEIAYYSELAAMEKDNVDVLVELGWRYYRKGDFEKAVKNLERAVELDSKDLGAHFNLALSYKEINLMGKAEEEFKKVVELDPSHKLALFHLGKMYYEQKRYDEAIEQLSHAVKSDPASADAAFFLGKAYEKKGYIDEALAAYERALELVPNYSEVKQVYYKLQAQSSENNKGDSNVQ